MKIKNSIIIGLVCINTGCSVFPEFLRPHITTPEQWQSQLPHNGEVNALNDWWAQFSDPVLSQLQRNAQADSPTLDKALASIHSARASVQSARAQGLPNITGSSSATRSKGANVALGNNSIETDKLGLDASWELDLFGGIKFNKQATQARLESKEIEWHQARVSLAAEVATEYTNFRACELSVQTLKNAYLSRKESARLTQISAQAGFTAPTDAILAEASASASESSLNGQQAQCDNYIKSLVALTNMPEATLRSELSNTQGLPSPAMFEVNLLPAQLLTQRPDLAIDERNLAAASAEIGVSKADLYPSVSLTGSIGIQRNVIGNVSTRTSTWSFGPSISLPIFDGGQRKAQVTIAQANFDTAMATYKQDVRNAVKEVEQALINLDSATKRAEAELISATQYARYFQAAETNWRAGGIDLLSLEDARRQMINAQTNLITQQQNRVLYWIALYKAFGGDWKTNVNGTNSQAKVTP